MGYYIFYNIFTPSPMEYVLKIATGGEYINIAEIEFYYDDVKLDSLLFHPTATSGMDQYKGLYQLTDGKYDTVFSTGYGHTPTIAVTSAIENVYNKIIIYNTNVMDRILKASINLYNSSNIFQVRNVLIDKLYNI